MEATMKIILFFSIFSVTGVFGTSQMWTCENGEEIGAKYKCDGINDCKDGSDELKKNCPDASFKCRDDQFSCTRINQCISAEHVCDGFDHCHDGSDEYATDEMDPCFEPAPADYIDGDIALPTNTCPTSEFECKDGSRCLSKKYVCDDYRDCTDGSDEDDCVDFDIDTKVVTAKPEPEIPEKCNKKPFLRRCKPFWQTLANNLSKKVVRKCDRKPSNKKCKRLAPLLLLREPLPPKRKKNKKSKLEKRCKKNPSRKGCSTLL